MLCNALNHDHVLENVRYSSTCEWGYKCSCTLAAANNNKLNGIDFFVQVKWTKCGECESWGGERGESNVPGECRKLVQIIKTAWSKKQSKGHSGREAHERLQLKWLEQESIQILQLWLGLKDGWTYYISVQNLKILYLESSSGYLQMCWVWVCICVVGIEMWPMRPHLSSEVVNHSSAM